MAKRKKKVASKPAMVISENRKQAIFVLAEKIAVIAPATTLGKGFCVRKVAEDMGLASCWIGKGNKRKMIGDFLVNVFRKYPRKPKKVILRLVKGGVDWSARKGLAVTRDQLDAVAADLMGLGFDLRKDLKTLTLPDPSRVAPPPLDLAAIIDRLELHPALKDDCITMFRNGHLNEAVRKALERFEKRIQDAVSDHATIGKNLMAKAFKRDCPAIAINALTTGNDESEQEGFMLLTMGAMAGMRNLYSHGDVDTMSAMDALERLAFVSLLFKRVDEALNPKP